MYNFSKTSIEKLQTVDTRLQELFKKAIINSPYDFCITEGIRTLEKQKEYVAKGVSKTLNSKHLTGKAVDIAVIVNNKITWEWKYYKEVADHIKAVAEEFRLKITWGGDWKTFKDGPHFELIGGRK